MQIYTKKGTLQIMQDSSNYITQNIMALHLERA